MAEMACLIVHPEWQGSGEGEILLRHMESRARAAGAKRLFVLTTRTSHWFIKRGFVQAASPTCRAKSSTTTTARATAWSSSRSCDPRKRHALSLQERRRGPAKPDPRGLIATTLRCGGHLA